MKNTLPIGSRQNKTRINHNGYVVRRVKTLKGWRYHLEHRLIWSDANGPIPEGGVIHHRNGIITDNSLTNLELCLNNGKDHLRDKHLDKFRTPEFRAAVSARFKGTTKSPQTRARMSAGLSRAKAIPENVQQEILRLRASGLSLKDISMRVPRSSVAVFRFLKRHGDVIPEELKKPAPWGRK